MVKTTRQFYRIAELDISVNFIEPKINNERLIPSFKNFELHSNPENLFFQIDVDDTIQPYSKNEVELIGNFDTGNGMTCVARTLKSSSEEGYQFIIKDIKGNNCCLLISDKDFSCNRCALNGNYNMRRFGLNNALMLIWAFKGSYKDTLLIHASLVRHNNKGYAFIAKSGTGKSTHVGLWLRYIENCDLMNDDNPIIRVINGEPYIFGSPWSGKTPCYRNIKAKLGAITRIERAHENNIEKKQPIEAFASLLPSCSSMKWDHVIFNNICTTITKVIETTDIFTLRCLPNKDAAILCHTTISK